MTATDIFNLLCPFAKTAVDSMAEGEPKQVLSFILKCADATIGDVPAQPKADAVTVEAFAVKALPHLQAVLPQAGTVGSIVAVTIDLAEFAISKLTAPVTGDLTGTFGPDGLPLPPA